MIIFIESKISLFGLLYILYKNTPGTIKVNRLECVCFKALLKSPRWHEYSFELPWAGPLIMCQLSRFDGELIAAQFGSEIIGLAAYEASVFRRNPYCNCWRKDQNLKYPLSQYMLALSSSSTFTISYSALTPIFQKRAPIPAPYRKSLDISSLSTPATEVSRL